MKKLIPFLVLGLGQSGTFHQVVIEPGVMEMHLELGF